MSTPTAPYPPPLSSPPTVESLEQLLAGLERPVQSQVPAPPTGGVTDELLFSEVVPPPTDVAPPTDATPADEAPAPPPPPPAATRPAPQPPRPDQPAGRPGLSWSAHTAPTTARRTLPPWAVAAGGAVAAAAAGLAVAVSTGLL